MKLGENELPVYWSEIKGCEVIKIGASGDNFGYVQNIKTLEEFKTYGYNSMKKVGIIKVSMTRVQGIKND